MAKLGEVCIQITDGSHNPPSGVEQSEYLMLSSKNIDDDFITLDSPRFLSHSDYIAENKRTTVSEGDLLMTIVGTIGRVAIVPAGLNGICLQRSVAVIKPNKEIINNRYLMYQLQNMRSFLEKEARGVAQKGIYLKQVSQLDIKLPELEQQKQIVKVLDKVTELISLRKQQLTKLDELVKARFVEMFGEISDNSMNWDCFTIGKLISTIESGWSGNGKQREKHADEIAVLKVSAVTKGYFIPTECKVLDDQHNIKKYVYPQKGDILFSRANTKEMVGATVLIKKDYPDLILPDKLWKIRFCTDVNPIYMKHVLSTTTVRNAFSAASTGTSGSMYNVSMEKFKGVIIPVPPLSVQNEFAAFVERVDQQKQTVQQSLEKLELMKKALMQEYFG